MLAHRFHRLRGSLGPSLPPRKGISFKSLQTHQIQGYHVRAAVRSESKASSLPRSANLEIVTVPDIVAPDAYTSAIKNVTSVIHCASPYHFCVTDNERDLLLPAREGTLNILRAAAKETSVKRVIITSSFAALNQLGTDPYQQPPKVYDESVWNPVTWEEAKSGVPRTAYQASKKFAELAAIGIPPFVFSC